VYGSGAALANNLTFADKCVSVEETGDKCPVKTPKEDREHGRNFLQKIL
jgi:hypothetical protein